MVMQTLAAHPLQTAAGGRGLCVFACAQPWQCWYLSENFDGRQSISLAACTPLIPDLHPLSSQSLQDILGLEAENAIDLYYSGKSAVVDNMIDNL